MPLTYIGQKDISVADLHPHPKNPNRGDVDAIAESLTTHGQYRSVVANKDGTLLAGHHVFYAAQRLGMPSLRVDVVDADEESAMKVLLADNRIAELGPGPDMERLLDVLLNLNGDLEGTGYDDDYLHMLEEMLAGAPDLDELEREAGPLSDTDLIERLVLIVGDETRKAWKAHRDSYDADDAALAALLER